MASNLPKRLGVFSVGPEHVEFWLTAGDSGGGWFRPPPRGMGRIEIGIATETWKQCLETLLHELTEWCFDRLRCRYYTTNTWAGGTADCTFVATHAQLSEALARVAEAAADIVPLLAREWKRQHTKKGAKR
jgi:hypothetical protein